VHAFACVSALCARYHPHLTDPLFSLLPHPSTLGNYGTCLANFLPAEHAAGVAMMQDSLQKLREVSDNEVIWRDAMQSNAMQCNVVYTIGRSDHIKFE